LSSAELERIDYVYHSSDARFDIPQSSDRGQVRVSKDEAFVQEICARVFARLRSAGIEMPWISPSQASVQFRDEVEGLGPLAVGRPNSPSAIIAAAPCNIDQLVLLELARQCEWNADRLFSALAVMRGASVEMPVQAPPLQSPEPESARPSAKTWGVSALHTASVVPKPESARYASVLRSNRGPEVLSKNEYLELCKTFDQYDFVMDRIAGECFKPNPHGGERLCKRLPPASFQMIRGFVTHPGVHNPSEFYVGKSGVPRSIQRMFDGARKVVDQRNPDGSFVLLHSHREATAEERRIEFAPAPGVSWLLIELVSP
jgi:hypothetical protein